MEGLLPCKHPLHWLALMSSQTALTASNRDIWSCGSRSYTFHLYAAKNSISFRNVDYGRRNSNVIISCATNHSLKMLALWKLILCHTVTKYLFRVDLERQGEEGVICLMCGICVLTPSSEMAAHIAILPSCWPVVANVSCSPVTFLPYLLHLAWFDLIWLPLVLLGPCPGLTFSTSKQRKKVSSYSVLLLTEVQ